MRKECGKKALPCGNLQRPLPLAISIIILLLPISAQAGDTPDTILMRQVLGNDLSSYRRADKERILRGYATHYIEVHSDGTSAADWTIRHENRLEAVRSGMPSGN